jgi:thiamine biosynthesis protein ThiS
MPLKVNGREAPMPDPPTLESLLEMLQPRQPYAVARNEEFVQRSKYQQCSLLDEDRIEIVHPSSGG